MAKSLDAVEILVDLQTGTISLVAKDTANEHGEPFEIEAVNADDEFAPQE